MISISGLEISRFMLMTELFLSLSSELTDSEISVLSSKLRKGFVLFSSMLSGLDTSSFALLLYESFEVRLSKLVCFLYRLLCRVVEHLERSLLGIQVRNSVGLLASLYWSMKIFVAIVR